MAALLIANILTLLIFSTIIDSIDRGEEQRDRFIKQIRFAYTIGEVL
jgi:hypothetical protein